MISVIIPLLNEGEGPLALIEELTDTKGVEVILVEGMGLEEDFQLLQNIPGITLLQAQPPRSNQLNLGAQQAKGEFLFFLHADSTLPLGWTDEIQRLLSDPKIALGAFSFSIDRVGWAAKLYQGGANLRSRLLQLPYGDQGFFLTKEKFKQMGGFEPIPIMEDYCLAKKARHWGRVATSPLPIFTSARRYKNLGFFKSWLLNQIIIFRFRRGVDLTMLKRIYARDKGLKGKKS